MVLDRPSAQCWPVRHVLVWESSRQRLWYCRCPSSKLIMVGDRYLTDIVYGNRHGMLTIRPRPLTAEGENLSVRWVSVSAAQRLRVLQAQAAEPKDPGRGVNLPLPWSQVPMAAGEWCSMHLQVRSIENFLVTRFRKRGKEVSI